MSAHPRRYASLDSWRGIACLLVLVWHRFWERTHAVDGFWLGVQLFFVISGYCIAAAVLNAIEKQSTFGQFMWRRIRRIGIPYLASLGVALAAKALTAPSAIPTGFGYWLRNLTMTQWTYLTVRWAETNHGLLTPWFNPALFLGVHWSLNYEEQFYLLCALPLVLVPRVRIPVLLGSLTGGIAVLNGLWPGRITGLFVDYWLQFFCGVAVLLRLAVLQTDSARRRFDVFLGVAAIGLAGVTAARGEFRFVQTRVQFFGQLTVCSLFALALISLRSVDSQVSASRPGRILGFVGSFSYSLYLVHRPLLEVLDPWSRFVAERTGVAVADALVLGTVIAGAYLFHRVFERPFLNAPLEAKPVLQVAAGAV